MIGDTTFAGWHTVGGLRVGMRVELQDETLHYFSFGLVEGLNERFRKGSIIAVAGEHAEIAFDEWLVDMDGRQIKPWLHQSKFRPGRITT